MRRTRSRKSPVRHNVKSHTREGKPVLSYVRGSGTKKTLPRRRSKVIQVGRAGSTGASTIVDYLKMVNKVRGKSLHRDFQHSPEGFLLKYGYPMIRGTPLTEPEIKTLAEDVSTLVDPTVKNCFYNAMQLALYCPPDEYVYVEGYVYSPRSIPLQHGWVIDKKGRVIDVTLSKEVLSRDKFTRLMRGEKIPSFRPEDNILGEVPNEWEYFGVPIKTKYLRAQVLKHGHSPPLIDYTHEFDILKLSDPMVRKNVVKRNWVG